MAVKKILIVGHGSIGIRHLTMINTIFDHNIEIGVLRRKNGGDFQFVRYFSDYREAMAWNPCFTVIASPSNTHADYLSKFRSSHILVEKPAVISKKELSVMRSFDNNKMLKVGYNYRYHPEFINMKNYVLKNSIKSAVLIHSDYLPNWHPWEDYRVSDASRDGAGLTLCHGLDLLLETFGIESFENLKVKKIKSDFLETEKETQHCGYAKNNDLSIRWKICIGTQSDTCFKICILCHNNDYKEFDFNNPIYPRNDTFIDQLKDVKKTIYENKIFNNELETKRAGEILRLCEG